MENTRKNIAKRCLVKTFIMCAVAIWAVSILVISILALQFCHKEPLLPLYWAVVTLIGFGSCVAMKGVIVNQLYGLRGHDFPGYSMAMGTPVLVISASDDDVLTDIVRIGNGFDLKLYPPIPKPINLAVLRQALLQIAADTERHGLATAGDV